MNKQIPIWNYHPKRQLMELKLFHLNQIQWILVNGIIYMLSNRKMCYPTRWIKNYDLFWLVSHNDWAMWRHLILIVHCPRFYVCGWVEKIICTLFWMHYTLVEAHTLCVVDLPFLAKLHVSIPFGKIPTPHIKLFYTKRLNVPFQHEEPRRIWATLFVCRLDLMPMDGWAD